MVLGPEIIVTDILQDRGRRQTRQAKSSGGNHQHVIVCAVHFEIGMNDRIHGIAFHDCNGGSVSDQGIAVAILRRNVLRLSTSALMTTTFWMHSCSSMEKA